VSLPKLFKMLKSASDYFPCTVQEDNIRGRHLVATSDFNQGDIIFQERPLIVGPCGIGIEKSLSFSTCLGCYKNVTTFYKCSKCGWPVCNQQCENVSYSSELQISTNTSGFYRTFSHLSPIDKSGSVDSFQHLVHYFTLNDDHNCSTNHHPLIVFLSVNPTKSYTENIFE
jgi:hypothetical protein